MRVSPPDEDPIETREWLDAFDALVAAEGRERGTFLLRKLHEHARARRVPLPTVLNTPYRNSVSLAEQPQYPGNLEVEQRLGSLVRWNALAFLEGRLSEQNLSASCAAMPWPPSANIVYAATRHGAGSPVVSKIQLVRSWRQATMCG